jgi:hypothetical protein
MAEAREHGNKPRQRGGRRVITKILVSLVGFLAAFGLTQLVPEGQQGDLLWSTGASLFVAAIVFLAQFLFEVEQRLDAMEQKFDDHVTRTGERLDVHARTTERQMAEGLSKIHLATELFDIRQQKLADPDEIEHMVELVHGFAKIASDASPLVRRIAKAEIARLANSLRQFGGGGDHTYTGEDREWLLGLTRAVEHSLQATSLSTVDGGRSFTDGGLWQSELGTRYLKEQERAVKRGVKIQRIFVIDRKGVDLTDLDELLEPHIRIGVEVRTLDLTPNPGIYPPRDLIIFDQVLGYQTNSSHLSGVSQIVTNTQIITNPDGVQDCLHDFVQLWDHDNVTIVTRGEDRRLTYTRAISWNPEDRLAA